MRATAVLQYSRFTTKEGRSIVFMHLLSTECKEIKGVRSKISSGIL